MPATATRIGAELLDLENQFWDACKGDERKLNELCASRITNVMADGITEMSRNEFVDMFKSEDYKLQSYKIDEGTVQVRELGPEAAAIAYRAAQDFTLKGKKNHSDAFYSSIWVKEGGRWKCAASSESIAAKA